MNSRNQLLDTAPDWKAFSGFPILHKNEVYVFSFSLNQFDRLIQPHYTSVLTNNELETAMRFRYTKDQQRSISGKYICRTVLAQFLDTPPAQIEFGFSLYKKPVIKGIEFNISHSGDYILFAVSPVPVGIDVEFISADFPYQHIIPGHFNTAETAFICEGGTAELLNFYTLWTRKEAILKATAEGLVDKLNEVESLHTLSIRKNAPYLLNSFMMDPQHVASIALNERAQRQITYLQYT